MTDEELAVIRDRRNLATLTSVPREYLDVEDFEFLEHALSDMTTLLAEVDRLKAHGIPAHQRELAERLVSMGHAWFNSGKTGPDRYMDVAPILSAMTYLLDDLVHGRREPRTYYRINDAETLKTHHDRPAPLRITGKRSSQCMHGPHQKCDDINCECWCHDEPTDAYIRTGTGL